MHAVKNDDKVYSLINVVYFDQQRVAFWCNGPLSGCPLDLQVKVGTSGRILLNLFLAVFIIKSISYIDKITCHVLVAINY